MAGPGKINAAGEYTPPGYLTADRAEVVVTARLAADPRVAASAQITVTPGFLQPLTPENVALGANGTVSVTGKLAVAGGSAGIHFALANTATGSRRRPRLAGRDDLPAVEQGVHVVHGYLYGAADHCSHRRHIPGGERGRFAGRSPARSPARTDAEILLNTAGVTSNPAAHQDQLPTLMPLGSSGGNNNDFDARGNTIADCCSGTLGALIQDNGGNQYLLSNNHVLARSDHAHCGRRHRPARA